MLMKMIHLVYKILGIPSKYFKYLILNKTMRNSLYPVYTSSRL